MSESTSNDLPGTQRATDEEAEAFKLDPHLIRLMWDEPFFAKVLRKVSKVRSEEVPTAGVLAKDGDIRMWWNPKFLAALTPDQVKGLLKHECYHLIFNHTTTRRQDPHLAWNYATDLAINSLIPESELPEGGLIPGKEFTPLTEDQKKSMDPEAVERFEHMSQLIASLPPRRSSEWYFGQLMQDEEAKKMLSENGEGDPMPGMGMDDHSGWDELSDEEKEIVKAKVKEAVKEAAKACDQKGQWGSVDSEMRERIRKMISGEIPWQSILKRFVGTTRRSTRTSTVRRLNRKYPGVHPGARKKYTSSIAVYVDQSGSVSNEELELLFGELSNLAKKTEFVIYNFDNSVDEDSERVWTRGRTPGISRTRAGGTNFEAVTKHANKNSDRFDGYIICSDGECNKPSPSRLKRCWVITPGRNLYFSPDRKDIVVKMKGKK